MIRLCFLIIILIHFCGQSRFAFHVQINGSMGESGCYSMLQRSVGVVLEQNIVSDCFPLAVFRLLFYSTKVRLEPPWLRWLCLQDALSIPRWYDWNGAEATDEDGCIVFQFHDGTIGTFDLSELWNFIDDFQFHDGTIGTYVESVAVVVDGFFQFHDGTIGTVDLSREYRDVFSFNSTMVRLEHVTEGENERGQCFQFHDGTIGTRTVHGSRNR